MGLVEDIKKNIDLSQYKGIKKVVLAYSGGVDTSIMIKLFQDVCGFEVIAVTLDLGQKEYSNVDKKSIKEKAEKLGARHHFIDAKREFITDYAWKAVQSNCLYQGAYPNSTALARPLISKHLVEVAKREGAGAVAHGSTGKGNDQVRFDVSFMALDPNLKIIVPVRDWSLMRDEEIKYAQQKNILIPVKKDSPYSIDANLWGRSIECGILEDPATEPPDDAYEWVALPHKAQDKIETVKISFKKGVPTEIDCADGKFTDPVEMVERMNTVAGRNGVGLIDHMEDRVVGLKSRENYECPAALAFIFAHKDLEKYVLTREENDFKPLVDKAWGDLVYRGLWYSPLMKSLNAYLEASQEYVDGWVKLKLYKGSMRVVGRSSEHALYDKLLATYDKGTTFNQKDAIGFIKLWGLNTVMANKVRK